MCNSVIFSDDGTVLSMDGRNIMPVVKGDSLRVICRANMWMYQSLTIVPEQASTFYTIFFLNLMPFDCTCRER